MMTSRFIFLMLTAAVLESWSQTDAKPTRETKKEDWQHKSQCQGALRFDPKTSKCVETCVEGDYGDTYGKIDKDSTTYIETYKSGIKKAEELVENKNRFEDCHDLCNNLKEFTCTAFILLPYEGPKFRCMMFETTQPRDVTFQHAEVYVRDCAKPSGKRQLEDKIQQLKRLNSWLEKLDNLKI